MMQVKKSFFPKFDNDDVLKLSTDIKSTITKLMEEIKKKDKIINDYGKTRHSEQKEYQKLFSENSKYKELFQQ